MDETSLRWTSLIPVWSRGAIKIGIVSIKPWGACEIKRIRGKIGCLLPVYSPKPTVG